MYKAYSGLLRTYATNILQDTDAAYEVVQDAFMAIWLNRKSLDDTKSLRNYLLRAVHNNSLRLIKAEEIRRAREEKAMEEQMMDWEEVPVSSQRNELLIPAIERLPEQSRKVLQMSYWEEKKNAVIADELSISIRTVETILYKVKKKLRKEIKKNNLFSKKYRTGYVNSSGAVLYIMSKFHYIWIQNTISRTGR